MKMTEQHLVLSIENSKYSFILLFILFIVDLFTVAYSNLKTKKNTLEQRMRFYHGANDTFQSHFIDQTIYLNIHIVRNPVSLYLIHSSSVSSISMHNACQITFHLVCPSCVERLLCQLYQYQLKLCRVVFWHFCNLYCPTCISTGFQKKQAKIFV